jgi:pimeloyl-ACP methyl ester carboxylesterase
VRTPESELAMAVPLDMGGGRPIVLIHGWGTNSSLWSRVADRLSPELHVLGVDLRGFGHSPAPAEGPSAFAQDLRELIDARGLEDALLVGWSMGGLVALDYLERFGSHGLAGVAIVDVSPRAREAPDWPVGVAVGRGFGEGLDR